MLRAGKDGAVTGAETNSLPTVLIADDEHHIRFMLEWKLKSHDVNILTAADGRTALSLAKKHLPALIISDYQMPYLDGVGLVKSLAEDPNTAEIPVILLTALEHRISRADLVDTSVEHILRKPFRPSELLELAADYLQAYRGRRGEVA
ncbi:MAG: response regulator [Planctomycetota bacterium]